MVPESNVKKFKDELKSLIGKGELLRFALALDLEFADEESAKKLRAMDLPNFKDEYERWYSVSMQVVKQVLPDRLPDFVRQYKDDKRKETDFLTYGISDYMIGLRATRGLQTVVDEKAAFPKFEQQLNILRSAQARFESSLFDMLEILQAHCLMTNLMPRRNFTRRDFFGRRVPFQELFLRGISNTSVASTT